MHRMAQRIPRQLAIATYCYAKLVEAGGELPVQKLVIAVNMSLLGKGKAVTARQVGLYLRRFFRGKVAYKEVRVTDGGKRHRAGYYYLTERGRQAVGLDEAQSLNMAVAKKIGEAVEHAIAVARTG